MVATLLITHDGRTVHEGRVTTKQQVWDAMAEHPPTQARGGVVTLTLNGKTDTVAISCHSANGPRWGLWP